MSQEISAENKRDREDQKEIEKGTIRSVQSWNTRGEPNARMISPVAEFRKIDLRNINTNNKLHRI